MRRPLLLFGILWAFLPVAAFAGGGIYRIVLDKPIHPITQEFVVRALAQANAAKADLILLVIDTPGGYVTSVESIQRAVLQSGAPVVAYVAPSGGRAASGGAFVALSCDLIAMAPGTTIGSAHPVSGLPIPMPKPQAPPEKGDGGSEEGAKPSRPDDAAAMEKLVNDLAAHMRSLAQNRGRDPVSAEAMVRESISLTEKEALEKGTIELIAGSEGDIWSYVQSHPIRRFDGTFTSVELEDSPEARDIPMTFREKALAALADPNLAFVLFLLGALGLFVEFKAPGLIFPGVLGGISLLLYLLSIPLLPVNVVGLLLVLLGVVFFILEVKVVSFGILTAGGVISLIAGGLMMYRHGPVPELRTSWSVVVPVALAFALILAFLLVLAARAFKTPVATGAEGMVGETATVREGVGPGRRGTVFIAGELWTAQSDEECPEGAEVVVSAVHGMVLHIGTRKG